MTYRVAIADDEPLARRRLRALLDGDPELTIVAECRNGNEAAEAIGTASPEIMFLDVQMPGIDGLSLVERMPPGERPHLVLVTAHDRYAVRAFDVHAVDYLLKPYDDERFGVALDRAKAAVRQRSTQTLPVRGLRGTTLVAIDSIDWVESADNYVQLHVGAERHLLRMTMTELEKRLTDSELVRVHRRAIVNLRRVHEVQPTSHGDFRIVLHDGATVTMSRRYRDEVERRLGVTL